MIKTIQKIITFLTFLFAGILLNGQDLPQRPNPPRLVNDFTGILSGTEIQQLEQKLVNFNNETSNQIVVVIVKSLDGYDPNDYANRLGENWKVGQKGFDNGIVILIKPKSEEGKGEISIQTGYGLEGAIPDATCNQIIKNEIIPKFKTNNYLGGIEAGLNVLMKLSKGEFNAKQYAKQKKAAPIGGAIIIFVLIFGFVLLFSKAQGKHHSVGKSLPFWLAMGMLGSSMGRGSSGGSFGGFSSGSGGFGGFGGGSFGGGGASGSW